MLTLGIDLGTNSVGWAFVETKGEPGEDDTTGEIIATGVRIFSQSDFAGRDPQSKASLAVARREARATRRRRDRYLGRRTRLLSKLIGLGLMPSTQEEQQQALKDTGDKLGGDVKSDVYALRSKGISERLTPYQVGRVFFQLDQRRGFKSNRKTDRGDNEAGKISTGVARLEQEMMATGAKSIGAFLHQKRLLGQTVRTRLRPEPDGDKKIDGYDFYPSRAALEREFDLLAEQQAKFHVQILTPENVAELRHIIFYQRPLKTPKPGVCSYNPKEERLPKAHPLFQKFRLLKELNELAVIGDEQQSIKLTPEQRDALLLEMRGKKSVTFNTLRKRLKLGTEWRFNKHTENRVALDGDEIEAELSNPKCFGTKWSTFPIKKQWEIISKLRDALDDQALQKELISDHQFSEEQAANVAKAKLPDGYCRMGESALSALIDALQNETDENGQVIVESEAARRVYGKSNSERDINDEGNNLLPNYQEVLERHIPPGTGNEDDIYDVYKGRISNPTVHIALNQLRRVVNAVIVQHGKPDRIAIELGRDIKLSDSARDKINKEIGRNTKAAKERSAKATEIGLADNGRNRLLIKLWEELHPTVEGRVCIYTGRPITLTMLANSQVHIDHILPFSLTLDDSQGNKLLCSLEANRQKQNRAPADVIEWNARYPEILARASALPENKRWRFGTDAMTKFQGERDFLSRQLTDMQYVSRMALTYLASLYPTEEADADGVLRKHSRVRALPGKMTEMLRRNWGLNELLPDHNYAEATKEKNRLDHRHHAIDGIVIACTSRSLIQRLASASSRLEIEGAEQVARAAPTPWQKFREDVRQAVNAICVSHKADHGTVSRSGYDKGKGQTAGQLHNDTAYGLSVIEKGEGWVVHRVPLTSFKEASDLDAIRDEQLKNVLKNFTNGKVGKDFEAAVVAFAITKEFHGVPSPFRGLRHVRIVEKLSVIPIKDKDGKAYKGYKGDSNYRFDVWKLRDGKWVSEIVTTFDAHRPDWVSTVRSEHPTAKKVLSLQQNDCLAIGLGDNRRLCRVVKFATSGQLTLAELNEAGSLKARDVNKDDPFKYISLSAKSLKRDGARQVRIDELGRVSDPGPRSS